MSLIHSKAKEKKSIKTNIFFSETKNTLRFTAWRTINFGYLTRPRFLNLKMLIFTLLNVFCIVCYVFIKQ